MRLSCNAVTYEQQNDKTTKTMSFSIDSLVDKADKLSPNNLGKPVVGLTANHQDIDATLRDRYYHQVVQAGGVPMIIPPIDKEDIIAETLQHIDALILTGGADIDPRWMGEEPNELLGNVNEERDLPELLMARMAYNRSMPVLGICRGMQTLAIAMGGHVAQDISMTACWQKEKGINHSQEEPREEKTHEVRIEKKSTLYNIYAQEQLMVNSFHHQVVDDCGTAFRPVAWSADGLVEAMESADGQPMMGVQWHPEWLAEDGQPLFQWLVAEAGIYKEAKRLHSAIVTLDSHCDTPMFFPQGADFSRRDSKIKMDLPKMTDGQLDAAIMVAYVPQPVGKQVWEDVAPFHTAGPAEYASLIFDKIEATVAKCPDRLAIARSSHDLLRNKSEGRKSIMLGIENALAIGKDLSLVEHFKNRGAIYFTLCHNGDNQVCDSARKSEKTWNGLSPFGERLVKEMNRQRVIVDLSHAAETSFYDALEISQFPVVCSHSNCKAVCSHERNITDDQLRALAKNGGVCQLTLYDGFVSNNPKEADIHRFMEHLDHAVRIMGVEHVGIGSDFDGDGGIPGLNDASDMLNFTRQLLLKRFSEDRIRMIWAQNWMRIMNFEMVKGENPQPFNL